MISLFGEKCITKSLPNTSLGLTYTDEEWENTFKDIRKRGILPGKPISSTVVNTALKQSCMFSYMLHTISDYIITTHNVESLQQYLDKIEQIEVGIDPKGLLIGNYSKCETALNYEDNGTIHKRFTELHNRFTRFKNSVTDRDSFENDVVSVVCNDYYNDYITPPKNSIQYAITNIEQLLTNAQNRINTN